MKTATLLAFLLLGLACTYGVTAEGEVAEDEPAEDEPAPVAEDELIEDDEEDDEDDENDEEDEEKRSRIYRPCRICKKIKVIRKYYGKGVVHYCTQRCRCKGHCRYNRCYGHGYVCGKYLCSRRGYPKCPRL